MAKVFIALLYCATASAQTGRAIGEHYYTGLIDRGVVVGAYFADVSHGEVVETAAFGKARPDSPWRAVSTSKASTAVGVMRLVERGQLDLDAM